MLSHRCDPRARVLADRHYSRQSIGAVGFVPPGRCLVLLAPTLDAYWVTSWPFAEYVKHDWAGAWICSAFRREGGERASDLIRDAVAATRWRWPSVPDLGMVTFIDPSKVRRKRDLGRCYRECGETKGGLLVLRLAPEDMPAPAAPVGSQRTLFEDHP